MSRLLPVALTGALLVATQLVLASKNELGPMGGVAFATPHQQSGASALASGSTAEVHGTEGLGLRVWSAPEIGSGLRAVLIEGARVEVLEGPVVTDEHTWYRVRYDTLGNTGWLVSQYLIVGSPSADSTLPIVPAQPSPTAPPRVP